MRFADFCDISLGYWTRHLEKVSRAHLEGHLDWGDRIPIYPTMLVCAKAGEFFVAELMGSRKDFEGLSLKKHTASSVNRYFYQFDNVELGPGAVINGQCYVVVGFTIAHRGDEPELRRRFPFLSAWNGPMMSSGRDQGALLDFRPGANFIEFQDCVLMNKYESALRIKHIHNAKVIASSTDADFYAQKLEQTRQDVIIHGVRVIASALEERQLVAGQLAGMYLSKFRETTIGEFLRTHPDVIRRALHTERFVYEPILEWQAGTSVGDERAINPDLLVQREDGAFDIYDLKTALLDKPSLTKGARQRRRFVDSVEEGVAQLAHYEEYFRYEQNRVYAAAKYQIRTDNPRLVLVIGNDENVDRRHVDEARRRLRNFELIDWDTVLQLYLDPQPQQADVAFAGVQWRPQTESSA